MTMPTFTDPRLLNEKQLHDVEDAIRTNCGDALADKWADHCTALEEFAGLAARCPYGAWQLTERDRILFAHVTEEGFTFSIGANVRGIETRHVVAILHEGHDLPEEVRQVARARVAASQNYGFGLHAWPEGGDPYHADEVDTEVGHG